MHDPIRMDPALEYIGDIATFYVPVSKVDPWVRSQFHEFFLANYNAYTVEESHIQGFWRRDGDSQLFGDTNTKYVVSFPGGHRVGPFVAFLSRICRQIGEECIYLTVGASSYLVRPECQPS